MKLNKVFLSFVSTILFTLACIGNDFPQAIPSAMPTSTEAWTATPRPTRTAIPTSLPDYPKATPIPVWVTDFADPIIIAVANRKPDFQDDFAMNQGWRNVVPGIIWPLYAEIQDGMLFLKSPERRGDAILNHPKLNRANFVLTLDLRFVHDQPEDTVLFQFDQFPGQSIAFDLTNNRNWRFQWGFHDNLQSMADIYEHFPPENIPVTIIMRGTQCAVYLNNDPLLHVENCRAKPDFGSKDWITSFRLLRDNARPVVVNFDNLKLWDLDNVPDLP